MKKRVLYSILVFALVLSACAGGGNATGGASNSAGVKAIFEIPADPVAVTPTLDTASQTAQVIPVSGGTLTATGADGTIFKLEIPADALTVATQISMTPVSALAGMPFGTDPLAVQLEPNGLHFNSYVTLTITPAQPIPADQQILFGYSGAENQLTLALPVKDSKEIQILLDHFSGAGVTKGLLADIEPVRARIGGSAEARIESELAVALQNERQIQLLGGGEGNNDAVLKAFEKYFDELEKQVIKPRLAAAGESCAAGRLALQSVLGMERKKQLLGMGSGGNPLIESSIMDTVANICMQEEYELCRDDHIIHRVIPVWLGLERQYQLLGLTESASLPVIQHARDLVTKCLSFELVFESDGTFDADGDGYKSSVTSTIKLQFNTETLKMTATAPLVNTQFDFRTEGCSVTSNRGGGTFTVADLAYVPEDNIPEGQVGKVIDFNLIYYPGNTTESYTIKCEDQPPFTAPPSPMWSGIFLVTHELELNQAAGGFELKDWEILGNEYFAKKEWIKESAAEGLVEAGTFKLYHRPK